MKVVVIVQARMQSTRLPGKVLRLVGDTPLLRLVLDRARAATTVTEVVAAIPDCSADDELAAAAAAWGYHVVRGDERDVLSRYVKAAHQADADVVIRVTGDCPLIDPVLIDLAVEMLTADPTLAYVALGDRFPDGEQVEVMRRETLEHAHAEAVLPSEREHVTPYIRNHPELFPTKIVEHDRDLRGVRLSVDEEADLEVIRALVAALGGGAEVPFTAYADAYLAGAGAANAHIMRDEGLWHSQNEDAVDSIGMRLGRVESDRWLERSRQVIPCATQTLSKGVDQFVAGVTPTFLREGTGCVVTDVDGNSYIDYPMALGPILLGYGYPRTVQAVTEQMRRGTVFTLPHPLEVEVAERLVDLVPSAEMVRFGKNGSDATTAAVRLVRAATGREVILTCGYHGWHDWYLSQTTRNAGIPGVVRSLVDPFPFNDLEALDRLLALHRGNVAGVILEISVDDPAPGFLEGVRDRVHQAGGLFILDEIITGFRYAVGGAQEHFGVTPDVTCLGKGMANGLPLSAVVGRRDVMLAFEEAFFSGTFGGETLSLAAAKVTLDEVAAGGVIEHIWTTGDRLRRGLIEMIAGAGLEVELLGCAPRTVFTFQIDGVESAALKGLFLQETVRRGVLFGGVAFITYSHREAAIERTLDICGEVFAVLGDAVATESVEKRLEGPAPTTVFRPIRN